MLCTSRRTALVATTPARLSETPFCSVARPKGAQHWRAKPSARAGECAALVWGVKPQAPTMLGPPARRMVLVLGFLALLPEANSSARLCVSTHSLYRHTLWQRPQTALQSLAGGLCGSGVWVVAILEGALAAEGVLGLLEVQMLCWFVCLCMRRLITSRGRCILMHDPSDSHVVWEAGSCLRALPAVAVCRCRVAHLSQVHACVASLFGVAC